MLCSLISFLSFFLTICEMHGILFLFNIIRITLVSMFACQVHDEVILEGPSLAKAMSKPFYGTNILKERKKRYNARKVQRNRVSFPPTRPTTPPTRKKQKAKSKQRQQQHPLSPPRFPIPPRSRVPSPFTARSCRLLPADANVLP